MKPILFTEYRSAQTDTNKSFLKLWNKKFPFLKTFSLNHKTDSEQSVWHFSKKDEHIKIDIIIKNKEMWEIIIGREEIKDCDVVFLNSYEYHFHNLSYDDFDIKMEFIDNLL